MMARKAKFTPREKKTMEFLGNEVDTNAVDELETLMDMASELQDLLYYKSIGAEVPQADVNKFHSMLMSSYRDANRAVKASSEAEKATPVSKPTFVIKRK